MLNIFFPHVTWTLFFVKSLAENEILFIFFLAIHIHIYVYSDKCIYCITVAFIVHLQIYRMLSNFNDLYFENKMNTDK